MRKKYSFEKICFIILSVCVLLFIIGIFNREDIKNATEVTRVNSISELTNEVDTLCTEDISNNVSKYSTKRLVVVSNNPRFDAFGAKVLSYDNIYILSYNTEEDCEYAYNCLSDNKKINSVEIDSILETGSNIQSDVKSVDDKHETELKLYLDSLSPSKEVKVAILDTGIDTSKFNNIIDLGINLSSSGEENSIQDDNGHGTEIATIIGCNDYIKLVPIKTANSDGKATILSTYLGIQAAIENDVDIINISMNTYISESSKILNDIVNEASNKGISVVVSAGNSCVDVKNVTPSDIESAIVVSAIEDDNCFASYSNYGETIDYCTYASYNGKSGTSYAAANVTSILADALSKGCDSSILDGYAIDINEDGKDSYFGKGLISYFSSTGVGKVPDSVLENEEDIDFENEDLENLSVSATEKTYGTDPFGITNGFLCLSDGTLGDVTKSGSKVTKQNAKFASYYKEGVTGVQWNTFSNYAKDYFQYEVVNGYQHKGKLKNCTVKMEYGSVANAGNKNHACGFAEEKDNPGKPGGVTGSKKSHITITITGIEKNFSGVVELVDLDKNEGWGVEKAYLAEESVWTNKSGCLKVTEYSSGNGVKVIGNHDTTDTDNGANHTAYIHVKESGGKIVLHYWVGDTSHSSAVRGVAGVKVKYDANGKSGASNMPNTDHSAKKAKYQISDLTPTVTGYTFSHWNTKADGTGDKLYPEGYINSLNSDTTTLYAQWTPNTYTMTMYHYTYNVDKKDWDTAYFEETTATAKYGETFIPSYTTTPTGFYNYSKSHDSWTVTDNGTFNLYYYPNSYTMTTYHYAHDINTGTWSENYFATSTTTALYGSTYTPEYVIAPTGFYNHSKDPARVVDGDETFNAFYYPKTCNITMKHYTRLPNSKDWNTVPFKTTTASVLYGESFEPSYVTAPTGYHPYVKDGSYVIKEDTTFLLYYAPNEYNLTINPNGGSIYCSATKNADNTWTTDITTETFTIKFQYDSKRHLGNFYNGYGGYDSTVGKPYRKGYIFEGWTVSGGTTTLYPSSIDNPSSSLRPVGSMADNFKDNWRPDDWAYYMFDGNYAGDVTLTAKWKPITYKINYDKGLTNN